MSRGAKLQQEAEQLLQKKSLFGKSKNQQAAADRYVQAGNSYKVDREWIKAGECHMKAAELFVQIKEVSSAADQALEAAKCFEKESSAVDQTVNAYKFAAEQLKDTTRKQFDLGQCYSNAANILLKANRDEEGLELLTKATEIFKKTPNSSGEIAKTLESWADYLVDKNQIQKAVEFYQEVIKIRFSCQTTQGICSRLFFKACLSYLQLNDIIGANKMIEDFLKMNPVFRNDFYYKFLASLIPTIDQNDLAAFDSTVATFQKQSTVDAWTKRRLTGLRKFVDSGDAAEDDDGLC